jgi:O-antigen ligase
VNVNGVRVGGAIMSDVFGCLSYLSGFCFFLILYNTLKSEDFVKKLLAVLSIGMLIAILFAFVQKYYSISLGNTSFWVNQNRINATFKDPNSFGVVLASFLPLLTGLILSFRRHTKYFLFFLLALGLFALTFTGSRSGLLGLGISSLVFFLLSMAAGGWSVKKRLIFGFSVFVVIVSLFLSFNFFLARTNLYKRIGWSLDTIAKQGSLNRLFTHKLVFWAAGLNMIKEYPLTGVGEGAYVVELPNYFYKMGKAFQYTDSAENYFVQVGSELGLIGLFIALWMFYEIANEIRKKWKKFQLKGRNHFILIGAISAVVSFFTNFFFHSYIGSYEVIYLFWLLVACIFFLSRDELKSKSGESRGSKFKIAAVILPVLFGAVFLWCSTHSLSIESRTREFKWDQDFGLYNNERDDRGFDYQWTKKTAGISMDNLGSRMIIPVMASHPDIAKKPVRVNVYSADPYFKKEELVTEIILENSVWQDVEFDTSILPKGKIHLILETDRTWQPSKHLGIPDSRSLAVKIGKVWFMYANTIKPEWMKSVKIISNENWRGPFKEKLYRNGISEISFRTDEENIAIRLNFTTGTAFGLGPYIIIRIDGKIIGKCMLNTDGRTSFVLMPDIKKGNHELSIEYINFIHDSKTDRYRFVYLGNIEIISLNQ